MLCFLKKNHGILIPQLVCLRSYGWMPAGSVVTAPIDIGYVSLELRVLSGEASSFMT
jgi:hypothetical protein